METEMEEKTSLNISIPLEVMRRVKAKAALEGVPMRVFVIDLLKNSIL